MSDKSDAKDGCRETGVRSNPPKSSRTDTPVSRLPSPVFGRPSPYSAQELVAIGKLGKPHGLRGEVSCLILTDFPERFEDTEVVQLIPPSGPVREVSVQVARMHHGRVLLKLEGVDDVDQAKLLRDHTVAVCEDELVELEEGEYYHFQLEGLSVVDAEGKRLGLLTSVLATPAHEIYVVETPQGELLIPAVNEFVLGIDTAQGVVRVRPPVSDDEDE